MNRNREENNRGSRVFPEEEEEEACGKNTWGFVGIA